MISSLSKWVCPPPETFEKPDHTKDRVEWLRCVPYIIIHLGALLVFFTPFAWPCLIILLVSYSARMFAITAFYHRYFSHRTFHTSRLVQFLGAFVACASGQRGPLWWAAHHRLHHRHSDTGIELFFAKHVGERIDGKSGMVKKNGRLPGGHRLYCF